jgi:hypothetical protein
MNIYHLIEDTQRQVNRLKGQTALFLDLITSVLGDVKKINERLDALERKQK